VRRHLLTWLQLAALWAVVVAQPLLDLLARSPEFFIAHQAGRSDILVLVAGLVVGGPVILALAVWLAELGGRQVRAAVLGIVIAGLVSMLAMQVLKRAGINAAIWAVPLSAMAGLSAAVAFHRISVVRTFIAFLSPAVVIVPAAFLSQHAIGRLLTPPAQTEPVPVRITGALTPVVMVVLDEVPLVSILDETGKIDEARYPHFAALARDGTWFRNATTVSDYTRWALPAIVSGNFPRPDAGPAAADHPNTLFTLFAQTHRLEVVEPVTRLCPERLCGTPPDGLGTRLMMIAGDLRIVYLHILLTDDLKRGLPPLTGDWANFGAAAGARQRRRADAQRRQAEVRRARGNLRVRTADARRFIDGISADDSQPTFYFMHTMLPHTPHVLLPSGQFNGTRADASPLEPPKALPDVWTDDEWAVAQSYQRHLLQLGFVDVVLGELTARLKEVGLYDRAVVVIASDHGTVFRSGFPRRDFAESTAAEVMRVPLIIKFPAGSAQVVPAIDLGGQHVSDRNVETVDLAPTVAEAAGVAFPWQADGTSVLDRARPERTSKTIFYDWARQRRSFDPDGPDARMPLQRRFGLFGGPQNVYQVPRPLLFADLIGRPLAELRVAEGGGEVAVDYLAEFESMDPAADSVAFDVAGHFQQPTGDGGSTTYVAVAVNGVVRAVTRTWVSARQDWLATPPLDAWQNGKNELAVFVVDADGAGPLLRRCAVRQGRTRSR
jgi:hypothetical protein